MRKRWAPSDPKQLSRLLYLLFLMGTGGVIDTMPYQGHRMRTLDAPGGWASIDGAVVVVKLGMNLELRHQNDAL